MVAVAAAMVTILLPSAPARAASVGDPDVLAAAFIADMNDVRISNGLAPYAVSDELTALATGWSVAQAAAGDIFHNLHMFDSVSGAHWSRLNENVGLGNSEASIEAAFVASPDHLANYLNTNYTHVGVGVVVADDGIYVTEDFGQAATARGGLAPAPPTTAASRTVVPSPVSPPPPPTTVTSRAPADAVVSGSVAARPAPAAARVVLVLEQLRTLDLPTL
jgi:hypothetical protein